MEQAEASRLIDLDTWFHSQVRNEIVSNLELLLVESENELKDFAIGFVAHDSTLPS